MFFLEGALAGARFAVTHRAGGVSAAPYGTLNLGGHVGDDPLAVVENRARVAKHIGHDRLVLSAQVHGRDVAVVDAPAHPDDQLADADALVTGRRGHALAVLVADCVPVLLAARNGDAIGAVHAGRRGMAAGVVPAAIEVLHELGAPAVDLLAYVGPAVCGSCYEVSTEMYDDVVALVPAAASTSRHGTPALDIRAGVTSQLALAGVDVVGVGSAPCTAETPSLYSYRRDGVTGRFAAVVWRDA